MRKLVVSLVVLVVLLVAVDFGLRFFATQRIGSAVAATFGLAAAPDVSISGFPFVLQAINGEYDTISIRLPDVQLGAVRGVSATADLIGVKIPLADALSGNTAALTAASTQVQLSIPVSAVASAAGLPNLTLAQQTDGSLQATATLTVFGQEFNVGASVEAAVVDSTLQLRSGTLNGIGETLPFEVRQAIGSLMSLDVPLTALPFGVTEAGVLVVAGNLIVNGTTSAISFAGR